jgi:tRNA (guanine10-N2)-dimethyltransferase
MTRPMVAGQVELALDNPTLARAELDGALSALGGRRRDPVASQGAPEWVAVEVPTDGGLRELSGRLAMARRVLRPVSDGGLAIVQAAAHRAGLGGATAAFRPVGGRRSPLAAGEERSVAAAYVAAGGRIDLAHPTRRFVVGGGPTEWWMAEEVVARSETPDRRMPALPFQRPVSLSPKLGRVAANLARLRRGERVVDPFVGTGALLLEAALLGARVSGKDRDPAMVRGALENLARFGVQPDRLEVGDAAEVFRPPDGQDWDAVLTDPPYGRSSGSGGEDPTELVRRILPAWANLVRPGGVIVVVLPGGPDPLLPPWRPVARVPDRVHRSLTREFCVYARRD